MTVADGTQIVIPPPAAPDLTETPSTGQDAVLDSRQALVVACGVLAELSGGTPRRATDVLSHLSAQNWLPAAAAGNFFLACLAAKDIDGPSRELIQRLVEAAAPAEHPMPYSAGEHNHRLDDLESQNGVPDPTVTASLDGLPAVAFRGELDIATRPALEAAVTCRLTATDTQMLLDLRGLTFCDVAGTRSLSAIQTQVTARGATLSVRPPTALSPRRMLHLAVASGWLPAEFAASTSR